MMNLPDDLEVSQIIVRSSSKAYWRGDSPYIWALPQLYEGYNDTNIVPGALVTLFGFTFQVIGYDDLRDWWLLERIAPPMS